MNSYLAKLTSEKMLSLLSKLSPEEQQLAIQEVNWEIQNTDLMMYPFRLDSPLAFCLDLEEAMKNCEAMERVLVMDRSIQMAEDPVDLIVRVLP